VHGQIAFSANLSTGGEAVYLYSQGSLIRVAGPGDPAPDGSTFLNASFATINAAGEVAFQAETSAGDFGVFLYNNGTITAVAHVGTLISGHNTLVAAFLSSINSSRQISFTAALADNTSAVVIASPTTEQSATALTQTSVAPLTSTWSVSPEQARAIFERITRTGVFANPDGKARTNSSPRSKQL
jgi:hypothetical protein